MKTAADFLKRCFYIAFLAFPLMFALVLSSGAALKALFGINTVSGDNMENIGFQNPVICALAVAAFMAALRYFVYKINDDFFRTKRVFAMPLIVFAVAAVPRMTLFFSFKSVMIPYSDGRYAWEAAQGIAPDRLAVKILQNGWNNFTGLLRYLITNFNIGYTGFMFFLFVCDAMIAAAIYLLAKEIFSSGKTALTASVLYAFCPAVLARVFYMSPDIMSQLGITAAAWLIVKMLKEKRAVNVIVYGFLAGCFAGAANGFKSVARVMVVAVLITVLLKIMSEKFNRRKTAVLLFAFIMFAVPSFAINKIGLRCSSYVLGAECRDLNTWHFINVGLNPYGGGSVAHGDGHYYNRLITAGTEPEEARNLLLQKLTEDWAQADITVPEFAFIKGKTVWAEDTKTFAKLMVNSLDEESMN